MPIGERTIELSASAFDFLKHANWNYPDTGIGPDSAPNGNRGPHHRLAWADAPPGGLKVSFLMPRRPPCSRPPAPSRAAAGASSIVRFSIPRMDRDRERRRGLQFEATTQRQAGGDPAPQLGPGTDQIILIVMDVTGDPR